MQMMDGLASENTFRTTLHLSESPKPLTFHDTTLKQRLSEFEFDRELMDYNSDDTSSRTVQD